MGLCASCCRKKKATNKQLQQTQKQKKERPFNLSKSLQEHRVFTENHFVKKDEMNCNLQHISERAPEFLFDKDPSLHPTLGPLFMQRSKSELKINRHSRKSQSNLNYSKLLRRKSNSCSTIFINDSTVSHPHPTNTIKCVTLAIFYHIKNRTSENIIDIFDERLHPFNKNDQEIREPDHRMIYRCVNNLFAAAHLSPECAIITLVYLERLLSCAEIDIIPCTWKRIILGAILLASKCHDDASIWNADFCSILKDIKIDDMNELERHFLEYIQFNINVPSSVYAKYYFGLRLLADQNNLNFPFEPLSKERALEMEAMSKVYQDRTMHYQSNFIRRCYSTGDIMNNLKTRAVLS